MKKIFITSAVAACLALIIVIGGAMYLLDYALKPDNLRITQDKVMERLRDEYPSTAAWADSMRNAGALRDTIITNSEGTRLHALYARKDSARGTAILVHGYTDCAERMLMLGQVYYQHFNFNILLPDHFGHGKSDGEVAQMGWKDRLNIERWTHISDSLWHKPQILHGISMGGATVMMCSGDKLHPSVRGIIDDCGYTSVWDEYAGELKNQFGLPVHPILDIASWLCQLRYGWTFTEASAVSQVRKSTLPMLFIHGSADTFVPTAMVNTLYNAKTKGYKQLWISPGSEHAVSYRDHPEEYISQMEKFLHKAL